MIKCFLLVFVTLALTNAHVAHWNTPNNLQPVHGLYVKPSGDGTTGDLYVAATEESGVKSQWLTDQPINFLPAATAHQAVAFAPNVLSDDTLNPQKRAVISAPVQYAYAYPVPGHTEGNTIVPYPYMPASNPANTIPSETVTPRNNDAPATPNVAQYQSLQYFYPQLLSAYAELLNSLKEVTGNEESTSSTTSTSSPQTPSMWPYAYPVQYVMVDPTRWAQNQASSVTSTPTTTSNAITKDNE